MQNNVLPNYSERGIATAAIGWVLVLLLVLVFLPFFVFGKIVPPEYIGIRQNLFTIAGILEKGYAKEGLQPGLHWKIPYFSDIHLLPGTFQFVNLIATEQSGDLDLPSLEVPTTDGSKVKTDITMVLRLYRSPGGTALAETAAPQKPEQGDVPLPATIDYPHEGPQALVTKLTSSRQRQLQRVADVAQKELRDSLSGLSTSDFYNPQLREYAAIAANHRINEKIGEYGVELWGSMIRRYVYAEKNIDDQIFAKNLQDQSERINAARSRLAEAKAQTERESALWDAKIRDLQISGESNVSVIESEGNLYQAQKSAEADLLVQKAKATVDREKAGVLSSVNGADVYIAREMAPLLATLKGGIVTGVDPYDIDTWVKKLTKTH